MPKGFTVKSSISLNETLQAMLAGAATGLTLASEHVLTEANKAVPHDEGTLERSGQASVDEAKLRAAVSYDTPYAVRQHEDMTLSHPGKGEPKWLENTMAREATAVRAIIQGAVKAAVAGAEAAEQDEAEGLGDLAGGEATSSGSSSLSSGTGTAAPDPSDSTD